MKYSMIFPAANVRKCFAFIYMYIYIIRTTTMIEGSLEVKLPTIWTDEKQSRAEAERREN
jgi:hypothetical protein